MIQRVNMAIGKNRALITTPCHDDITANLIENYKITTIAFEFHDSAMKLKLLWKLIGMRGNINESEMYYYDTGFSIEENRLELIELLAPINITENIELKKIAGDYLDGTTEREKFEQEVIAHCVAEKLSK